MTPLLATDEGHARRWQAFVEEQSACGNYHRWRWKQVLEATFGWPTYYWMTEREGKVVGILPLVWQKSWFFGSFMTSLPFLNYGGVVAEDPAAEQCLVQAAIALAQQNRVDYLELRHRSDHQLGLPSKRNKLTLILPVEADTDRMWQRLDPKVRTDIRKAEKSGLTHQVGGEELLEPFYRVFVHNMRDLGTPVYSPSLFREIFRAFPAETRINVVRSREKTVAASFLIGYRDTLEVPWSCSLREYLPVKPNMLLYWRNLCFAGTSGYRFFDFGRSSVGSGTHRFKKQWGGEEVPLHWDYWIPSEASLPELNPQNPRYRLAIGVWRRLPLAVTRCVGPYLVRRLP